MTDIRKILLLTDAYPPEIRSCPVLMQQLAFGLKDRGYEITVLTTYPTYNLTPGDRDAFRNHFGKMVATEDGVRVIRVPVPPLHNVGPVTKGLSEMALPLILSAAGALLRGIDAVIVFSPPLTLGIAAAALKFRFGCRVVLNVQDLMPQAAVDLGVLRNPFLIRAFEVLEASCYRHADVITCHSEGNMEWMRRNRPSVGAKLELVPNWVDVEAFRQAEPDPDIRSHLGLADRFVFISGGVMGFAQDLETVIDAARRLRDRDDIAFLFVGDGVAREGLEARADGLPNVRFHPFVEPERYASWLKTMDAGMVTLKATAKTPVVPSKILGFMASGLPYLAALGPRSDARGITTQGKCGVVIEPGDVEGVASAAQKLAGDPVKARSMGQRGLAYCRRHFSQDSCIDRYHEILQSL